MGLIRKSGGTNEAKVREIAREEDARILEDGGTYTPGKTYNFVDEDGKNKDFLATDVNGDGSDFTLVSATDFVEIRSKFINKDDPTNEGAFIQSTGIKKNGLDILKSDGSIDIELTGGEVWVYDAVIKKWNPIPYTASNPVTVNKRTWDNTDLGDVTTWDFVNSDNGTSIPTVNTDGGDYLAPWLFVRENAGALEFVQLLSEKVYGNQNTAQRQETALPNEFPTFLNSYKLVGKMMARVSENDLNRDRVYRMNSLRDENKLVAVGTTSESAPKYEDLISDSQVLEPGGNYIFNGFDNPVLPSAVGIKGAIIRVWNNEIGKIGVYKTIVGDITTPITGSNIPGAPISPASELKVVSNGTRWEFNTEVKTSLQLVDADFDAAGGVIQMRQNICYESLSTQPNNILRLPQFPGSLLGVRQAAGSTSPTKIQVFDTGGTQRMRAEDFSVFTEIEIEIENNTELISFSGNPAPDRWNIYRPWIIAATKDVTWHTDINTDDALISRLNLFPEGSSLTSHTAPQHVVGGSYSVAIGDITNGSVTSEINYISNGVAGAGGAWIRQTQEQDTKILDNIQINLSSSGTNAGSNISLTFVDKDGIDYPSNAWVYSANLVQYTGGTATIITDKALYSGTIGIGRNKQGDVKFYYTGETPNGISEIRIDNAVASTAQNVIITYQGTNYNDSFNALADLNSPLPWTTIIGQNEATDQAAYITELTEYTGDQVFSMREPDNTDPDYNKLFNWQVITGQTVLDTEVTDTSNEAELIAIKPKLERFGIGTVTPEGLLDDWKPNTAYNSGDRFVAPMPINSDFITNNGAEVGLNYIFQTNVATPDTITAFDDIQADSGNYELIGVYRINGLDDRVLNGNGTIGLDPLTTLSNSAKNEFIHWTTTDTPQTIRLLPAPSFVTIWKDYTGANIVQPTGANEDFVLPADSQIWVHRAGNSVQIIFESNEGGSALNLDQQVIGTSLIEERGIFKEIHDEIVGGTTGTITFPDGGFTSIPKVTATAETNGHNINIRNRSLTGFTYDQWDVEDVQQGGNFTYFAKGLK